MCLVGSGSPGKGSRLLGAGGAGFIEELAFKTDYGGTVREGTFHSRLQGHSKKAEQCTELWNPFQELYD